MTNSTVTPLPVERENWKPLDRTPAKWAKNSLHINYNEGSMVRSVERLYEKLLERNTPMAQRYGAYFYTASVEAAGVASSQEVERLVNQSHVPGLNGYAIGEWFYGHNGRVPEDRPPLSVEAFTTHPSLYEERRTSPFNLAIPSGASLMDAIKMLASLVAASPAPQTYRVGGTYSVVGEDANGYDVGYDHMLRGFLDYVAQNPKNWFHELCAYHGLSAYSGRVMSLVGMSGNVYGTVRVQMDGMRWIWGDQSSLSEVDWDKVQARFDTPLDDFWENGYDGPDEHSRTLAGLFRTTYLVGQRHPELTDAAKKAVIRPGQKIFPVIRRWYARHVPGHLAALDKLGSQLGELVAAAAVPHPYTVRLDWTPEGFGALGEIDGVDDGGDSCFQAGGQHELAKYALGMKDGAFVAVIEDEEGEALSRCWGLLGNECVFLTNAYIRRGTKLSNPIVLNVALEAVRNMTGWELDTVNKSPMDPDGYWAKPLYINGGGIGAYTGECDSAYYSMVTEYGDGVEESLDNGGICGDAVNLWYQYDGEYPDDDYDDDEGGW